MLWEFPIEWMQQSSAKHWKLVAPINIVGWVVGGRRWYSDPIHHTLRWRLRALATQWQTLSMHGTMERPRWKCPLTSRFHNSLCWVTGILLLSICSPTSSLDLQATSDWSEPELRELLQASRRRSVHPVHGLLHDTGKFYWRLNIGKDLYRVITFKTIK